MKVSELITLFRQEVRDSVATYLWSDSEVVNYLNDALHDLAIRANYFYDTTTFIGLDAVADDPLIPTTSIPTGDSIVPADPGIDKILSITRASVAVGTAKRNLSVMSLSQLERDSIFEDYGYHGTNSWETSTGTPRVILTDYEESLRLVPIPSEDTTVDLRVFRLPLAALSAEDDEAWQSSTSQEVGEIAGVGVETHQRHLLQFMKYKAYLKDDADAYDLDAAAKAKVAWDAAVQDMKMEIQKRRFPAGNVRYGGL